MIATLLLGLAPVIAGQRSLPIAMPDGLPSVLRVTPGTGTVHENLLRISIWFAGPTGTDLVPHLAVLRADGTQIEEPFLHQQLWSPDGRTLTVLFGPGRVKTGLIAHDTLGRPLHAGEQVTLTLYGRTLATWKVTEEWNAPIDPQLWSVSEPRPGTREALVVSFPQPIDGMDGSLLKVVQDGSLVQGTATLLPGEAQWSFKPDRPWQHNGYSLLVHPHLEDPYGNEVRSAFESRGTAPSQAEPVVLAVKIKRADNLQSR